MVEGGEEGHGRSSDQVARCVGTISWWRAPRMDVGLFGFRSLRTYVLTTIHTKAWTEAGGAYVVVVVVVVVNQAMRW